MKTIIIGTGWIAESFKKAADIVYYDNNGSIKTITGDMSREEAIKHEALFFEKAVWTPEKYDDFISECFNISSQTIYAMNEIQSQNFFDKK